MKQKEKKELNKKFHNYFIKIKNYYISEFLYNNIKRRMKRNESRI